MQSSQATTESLSNKYISITELDSWRAYSGKKCSSSIRKTQSLPSDSECAYYGTLFHNKNLPLSTVYLRLCKHHAWLGLLDEAMFCLCTAIVWFMYGPQCMGSQRNHCCLLKLIMDDLDQLITALVTRRFRSVSLRGRPTCVLRVRTPVASTSSRHNQDAMAVIFLPQLSK